MSGKPFQISISPATLLRAATILAAAFVAGATTFADDDDTSTTDTESETTTTTTTIDIKNLNENSPDYIVDSSTTLYVKQTVDDIYTGTLSGPVSLEKSGEANLIFEGQLSSVTGYIYVDEGIFTFSQGFSVSGAATEVNNDATVVFSTAGTVDASLISIGGSGVIENIGSGTITTGSIKGSALRIYSGTIIVAGTAEFDDILVAKNAELCIGKGDASGVLSGSGTIVLEEDSTLRFNRTSSASSSTYAGTISGAGDVVFDGSITTQLTGAEQTYTGTTTVNAGTLIFMRSDSAEQVNVASPLITVNGGSLSGNAVFAGDVEIKGKYFGADGTTAWGGTLSLAIAGATMTVKGDLTFDPMTMELVTDGNGNYGWAFADYGGVTQVYLSEDGTGRVDVEGKLTLGGLLVLSGSSSLTPGQVAIFMHSDTAIEGDFAYVSVESDNVMLVTSGVAGVGANEYGIAAIENRNLRERSSFVEHKGISNFVDYVATQTAAARPNEVGQAVNLAMGDSISRTLNNFSPLAHCSLLSMGVHQSNLEVDYLRRVFPTGTRGPASNDGITVPANLQFFGSVLGEFVQNKDKPNSPIFDTSSVGVLAGIYTWVDSERLVGATVGAHYGEAQIHGYGSNSFDDAAIRLRLFAGMMPANESWNLLFGVSAAGHAYDIDHDTATGTNRANEYGMEAGAFISWQFRDELVEGLWLVPFARMDFNYVRVDTVREKGSPSALKIDAFGYSSFRGRFGFGLEKIYDQGTDHEITIGADFGFVAEFGKDPKITSEFIHYDDSSTTISGTVDERAAFEITPRARIRLDKNWVVDFAIKFQTTSVGSTSNAITLGVSSNF